MKIKKDSKTKITTYTPKESVSELCFNDRFNHTVSRVDASSTYNDIEPTFKEEILRGITPLVDNSKLRYGIAPKLQPLTKSKQEAEEFMAKFSDDVKTALNERAAAEAAAAEAEAQAKAAAEAAAVEKKGGAPDVE